MNEVFDSQLVQLKADAINDKSRQWVHILTSGAIKARDGRTFILSRPEQVIDKTREWAKSADVPVDYEHQTQLAKANGQPAPAAGWIKDFAIRENGIWALVEWTERATAMIQAKEYRYVSPTIVTDKNNGEILFISSVALVNVPALKLTALAKADLSAIDEQERNMEAICEALGLPDDADEQTIITAVQDLRKRLEILEQQKDNPADPKSLAAVTVALETLNTERLTAKQEYIKNKVDNAIREGVIVPAMRDWAEELCGANEESFDSFAKSVGKPFASLFRPSITPEMEARLNAEITNNRHNMTEVQLVADQLGIKPETINF